MSKKKFPRIYLMPLIIGGIGIFLWFYSRPLTQIAIWDFVHSNIGWIIGPSLAVPLVAWLIHQRTDIHTGKIWKEIKGWFR